MATWYLAKIRFNQQDEKGGTKIVNQSYLFDAVSYTDCEARVFEYFSAELQDFILVGLTKMKFNEVFFIDNNAELWFKCRVQYIVFDEKTQNDKKVPFMMLLNAHDIKEAYGILVEKLGTVQDYIISDINVTKILDVIPYEEGEIAPKPQNTGVIRPQAPAPQNLKPLSEVIAELEEKNDSKIEEDTEDAFLPE